MCLKGDFMKRIVTIILTISIMFVMCFGTTSAFAIDPASVEAFSEFKCLEAPASVDADALGKTSIKVSWDEVDGAEGYIVYSYNSKTDSYNEVARVDADKTSYTKKGLSSGTKKSYKVAAYVYDVDGNVVESVKSDKASATTEQDSVEEFMETAKSRLGKPYVGGAAGPNAFDCSGFVYWVVKNSDTCKVKMSRGSAQGEYSQIRKYDIGTTSLSAAKPGDILFFGSSKGNIWHVGIYYGGGKQIHAFSTWGKVAISPVSMSTSNKRLVAICRLPME